MARIRRSGGRSLYRPTAGAVPRSLGLVDDLISESRPSDLLRQEAVTSWPVYRSEFLTPEAVATFVRAGGTVRRRGAGFLRPSPAKHGRRPLDTSGRDGLFRVLQVFRPNRVLFCLRRKVRRQVLFAKRKVGFRGSSPGPYRRTGVSSWRC